MGFRRSNFQRSSGGSRARRPTDWTFGPGGTAKTSLSASSSVILGAGISPDADAFTVVRLRGRLELTMLTSSAPGAGFHGAFGIGVVAAPAFIAGITALPTPITELDWDGWMYHQVIGVTGQAAASPFGETSAISMEVDSKAMRKMDIQMIIFAAIEVVEIGAATADVFFNSRMLVKNN